MRLGSNLLDHCLFFSKYSIFGCTFARLLSLSVNIQSFDFSGTIQNGPDSLLDMFTSFDGNHRKARNISLGGQRDKKDKQELLRIAQQERIQREQARKALESAIKIQVKVLLTQAFYRHRKLVKRNYDLIRQEWDTQLTGPLDALGWNRTGSQLTLFYAQKDHTRISIYLEKLSSSNGLNTLMNQHFNVWSNTLSRLLSLMMQELSR